jgi:leucyl-tRNA synthetase
MAYDFRSTEKKWQAEWAKAKLFEPEPNSKPKYYITVAYPYPSGGMHIGHARTYTVPDIFARYKRMKGFNTLFPMAWHVTGTPIVGAVKRLKDGEEKQLRVLKEVYGMSDGELAKIDTPMDYARYFIENHYVKGMQGLGYSIDWRRQFTTNDLHYNQFVTWQYNTLKSRDLVREGKHPVRYCTQCKNPVTAHDLLEGENAEIQEWTLLKFKLKEDPRPETGDSKEPCFIVAATLRPETMHGQTNMWVNPDVEYIKAKVGSECWIISSDCANKLGYQGKKAEIIGTVKGSDLVGKYCSAPALNREIIILPSQFPNPRIATGFVTSVPSDAPYDWIALKELQGNQAECSKYGLDCDAIKSIQPIPIIKTKKFGENAAIKICEQMGIRSLADVKKLDAATKEVYKEGYHTGVMLDVCGDYKGMPVERAKEAMKQDFLSQGLASTMNDFNEPVTCRCGGMAVVSDADSWFIRYSDEGWKALARGLVSEMQCIPEANRAEYLHTIDWLNDWPCVRNFGLGTHLPWDKRFMIEPLSDSTIYMSYYTIAHLVKDLKPEQLTGAFFDFVLRNKGTAEEASKSTSIDKKKLEEIKKSYEYWYPLDWRCTAGELIGNHLTFMILHHAALFPRDKWVKGIVCFGVGLLEGSRMSSSRGNVVLLSDALEKFGADVVRLFLMSNVEPWQDFDWREKEVIGAQKALMRLLAFADSVKGMPEGNASPIDKWLLSKWQVAKKTVNDSMECFQTRKALQAGFFEVFSLLKWYEKRGGNNKKLLEEILDEWIRILAPFTPHACEEIWASLGEKGFVSSASFPEADESKIDKKAQAGEKVIEGLISDVEKISEMTKKKPEKISIYLPEPWKYEAFDKIKQGAQISDLMKEEKFRKRGKEVPQLFKKANETEFMPGWSKSDDEMTLTAACGFLEKELGCSVTVNPKEDPKGKARFALPARPAIYME